MKSPKKRQKTLPIPSISNFRKKVLRYFATYGRNDLPWRNTYDPYKIMVSEVMLQQTQVSRVVEKYKEFLKLFPKVEQLAKASLRDVLKVWSGLGYNRRAKFLHEAAKAVMKEYKGKMPKTAEELERLPGIGPYTARAIAAFAYNTPSVFIETNIRTVFIHHFFPNEDLISDKELLPLITEAAIGQDTREWYAALMDYGVYLKQTTNNPSRRSAHHTKQEVFKGSLREARGLILKVLSNNVGLTKSHISIKTGLESERVESALRGLEKDGMVVRRGTKWGIA